MELEFRGLEISYPGRSAPLLSIPERRVASGARVLLRGASGSGKTSLLQVITGLMPPAAGDVRLGERWLKPLSPAQRTSLRRDTIGIVFQRLNILEHLTAVENVQLGHPGRHVPRDRVLAALARVDMEGHADRPAWQLSLGEQQRVAVARVLATRPTLVVADEPTSSLDEANAHKVLDALIEATEAGATLVVATHDDRIAERFTERWIVADGGCGEPLAAGGAQPAAPQARRRDGGDLPGPGPGRRGHGARGAPAPFADPGAAVTAGIEQVDRDVDAVVGPKSGNLDLYQGALQLQAYTPDVMTGHEFSVAVSLKDDIRPRHLMPIARFGQVQGLPVLGVTEAWWARPAPLTAPSLADGRWPTAPGEAVLGAAAAAQLKLQPGDRLAATGELAGPDGQPLWTGELTVVGRVAPLGHAYDRAVLTEMETAREPLRRAGQAGLVPLPDYHPYTHVLVNLDPADSRAREQLFQIVHVRRSEQVAYVAEVQEQLRGYAGVGQALSWAITLLVGLMAVGMVGGLMNERASALRPQLAVLRAQGYHRREVAAVVLLEGLFIVGAGLALGVGLEALVTPPLLAALPLPPGAPPGWTAALHPGLWAALLAAGLLFALPALLDLRPAGVRGNPVPGT